MSHEIQNYNPPNNVGNDDEEIDNPTDRQPDDWSDPPNDQSTEVKALETMVSSCRGNNYKPNQQQ